MSKDWYAAQELAGLPGMPCTVQGIQVRAKSAQWSDRRRTGRGGGKEYHLSSLPEKTRRHLLRQAVVALPAPVVSTPAVAKAQPSVDALAGWQREVMHARLAVCALIDEISLRADISLSRAIEELLILARDGALNTQQMDMLKRANARRGKRGDRLASRATIYRWLEKRSDATAATAPKTRPPAPPPTWMAPLLRLYQVELRNSSAAACIRDWRKHFPEIEPPALRTAQRHLNELPPEVRLWGRRGRNALRAVQPFVRRSTDGLWPMDVVTVDGHLFKAYTKNPMDGRLKIRPEVTTYLDVATRRAVGHSCWLAESQVAIWAALREMALSPECGVPAIHYSDNGAYRGEIHRSVMERIGSQMCFSQAYRAQSRGMIERLNSSVWVPLAQTFPTYVNDDSDPEYTKKALRIANSTGENLLEWPEFLARVRQALDDYNNRPHSSLPGRMSPNEAWAKAVDEGWKPTLLEGDGLFDILIQMVRKVDRGEVRLPWGRYFHDSLRSYHGQKVAVCIHPTDGNSVGVLDREESLICVAERDGNVRPYMPESMVNHGRLRREAAAIKRKEKHIANYRLEADSARSIPRAEIVPLPQRLESDGARSIEEDHDEHYTDLFNSYMREHRERAFADSIDMPAEKE